MLHPRPVVVRTMDLGGDKIPRFAAAGKDPLLASGLRGLAYSLAEGMMFRTQLRAIARAAQRGNIRVLFPMVMGPLELREACSLLAEALAAEGCEEKVPVGAMIETPAAAFRIGELLDIADFLSIGTNDLSYSILAMDRGAGPQDGVAAFLHPTVLRVTEQVVETARKRGVALTHPITHISQPMSLPGEFDSGGEVHDALKAEPDGLHAGLAVALAPQEAAQPSDQAQHRVEAWGLAVGERC